MKSLTTFVAAAALATGMGAAVMAESVTLKYHNFAPLMANQNAKFAQVWADRVQEQSNGEITVEMYGTMQLGGKPPQLVDQVREGVVDVTWTVAGYSPGRFSKLEVFELPFMAASAEATSQAVMEFAQTTAADQLSDYKVLAVHVHAPGKIHTKETLVKSITDLEGLKMRGPTRVITGMLGELGATPVGMPIPAVAPSLSKGVIDGMVVPWEIMPPFKLQELTKMHTTAAGDRGFYTSVFLFIMNKNAYENMTDEQKAVIDANAGMELAKFAGQSWDSFEGPARMLAEKAGGQFHEMDGAALDEMKAAGEQVTQQWIQQANEKGLDGAALVQEARDLIAKYEAQM